jgi:hypothetical protein
MAVYWSKRDVDAVGALIQALTSRDASLVNDAQLDTLQRLLLKYDRERAWNERRVRNQRARRHSKPEFRFEKNRAQKERGKNN